MILCGTIVGFVNGFFGGGGILPLCIVSALVYIYNNAIDLFEISMISVGSIVGGFCGAFFLVKLKSKTIKIIFAIVMLIAGVKMII